MEKLRVVLLSCCAPCSAGAIKQLKDGVIDGVDDFIVLFYNPNIFPETEYTKRMQEQIKYCRDLGVKYAVLDYDHDAWRNAMRGMEDAPERGNRCSACFAFRFNIAKKFAIENGYNSIASVLGVSRHKSQAQVDAAAESVCDDKICYLPIKWDESLRQKIGHETPFYRQNYCGCEFSIRKV